MSQKNLPDRGDAPLSDLPSSDLLGKFQSPWHAELFALTLSLHKAGHFSWPEWTQYLGKALKEEHVPEFDLAKEGLAPSEFQAGAPTLELEPSSPPPSLPAASIEAAPRAWRSPQHTR